MIIRCPQCEHSRSISESKIPPTAELATCPRCKHRFRFRTLHRQVPAQDERVPVEDEDNQRREQRRAYAGLKDEGIAVQEVLRPQSAFRESAEQNGTDIWDAVDAMHRLWETQLEQQVTQVESPLHKQEPSGEDPSGKEPKPLRPAPEFTAESPHHPDPVRPRPDDAPEQSQSLRDIRPPDRRQREDDTPGRDPAEQPATTKAQPSGSAPGGWRSLLSRFRAKDAAPEKGPARPVEKSHASSGRDLPGWDPAYQTPAEQDPAYQEPTYQEPAYQEPAYQDLPYQTPADQTPAYDATAGQYPAYQAPAYQAPAYQAPAYQELTAQAPAPQALADETAQDALQPESSQPESGLTESILPESGLTQEPARLHERPAVAPNADLAATAAPEAGTLVADHADSGDGQEDRSGEDDAPAPEPVPQPRKRIRLESIEAEEAPYQQPLPASRAPAGQKPIFPYGKDGPAPEERVEHDLRMLNADQRTGRPVRDLGKLKEFPDYAAGDERPGLHELYNPNEIPWENPARYGWIRGFMATLSGVMFRASSFFTMFNSSGSLAPGYLFFLVLGYVTILGSLAWGQATVMLLPEAALPFAGRVALPLLLLLAPLALGLMLLFVTGFIRICLLLFAPDKADFVLIYKVASYSVAPFVLSVVPFVGPPLGAVWFLASLIAGCRHGLGLSWPLAVLTPLPPAALLLGGLVWYFL